MSGDRLDKKEYSNRNLVFILGLIVQGFFLYFSLREAIHDEITQRIASIEVLETKIESIEKRMPNPDKKLPPTAYLLNAILPNSQLTLIRPRFKIKIA